MKKLASLITFCLWPSISVAQTAMIRSGEHDGFTRLVISMPQGAEWTYERQDDSISLQLLLNGSPVNFDLAQVFSRIDRKRISGVAKNSDENRLEINLACNCTEEVYPVDGGLLVLDVIDASLVKSLETSDQDQRSTNSLQIPPPSLGHTPLIDSLLQVRTGSRPGLGPPQTQPLPLNEVATDLKLVPSVGDSRHTAASQSLSDLSSSIAEGMAKAVTRGLLQPPRLSAVNTKPSTSTNSDETLETPRVLTQSENQHLVNQLTADLSQTGGEVRSGDRITLGGHICIADTDLNLEDWTNEDIPLAETVAKQRGLIFGEFDRINEDALISHAKTLIAFGFGGEARQVLSLSTGFRSDQLTALSYLVEGNNDPTRMFLGQTDCSGRASLWSVLAEPKIDASTTIDGPALVRTFELLPENAKNLVGSILIDKLIKADRVSVADEILRRLERINRSESHDVILGRATLEINAGKVTEAHLRLKGLLNEGGTQSPEAVANRISLLFEKNTPVPQRIVDLSEAFRFENRDSEHAIMMWSSLIKANLSNKEFDSAFQALNDRPDIPDESFNELTEIFFHYLVENGNDIEFMKKVFLLKDFKREEDVSGALSIKIAKRLIDLRLFESAQSFLNKPFQLSEKNESDFLRSATLIELGRPLEAERILAKLQSNDAKMLRAEARASIGDHTEAFQILLDLDEFELARTSAWIAGDWTSVASLGNEDALSQVSSLTSSSGSMLDLNSINLVDIEELARNTEEIRSDLKDILDETALE